MPQRPSVCAVDPLPINRGQLALEGHCVEQEGQVAIVDIASEDCPNLPEYSHPCSLNAKRFVNFNDIIRDHTAFVNFFQSHHLPQVGALGVEDPLLGIGHVLARFFVEIRTLVFDVRGLTDTLNSIEHHTV